MKLLDFISKFTMRSARKREAGILRIAFLISGLDGKVTDDELKVFRLMARKTCGFTEQETEETLAAAQATVDGLVRKADAGDDEALVDAFVDEAQRAMPDGFLDMSLEDIRRAVVIWVVMGMGDGDYSGRERMCIEALRRYFAELKAARLRFLAASANELSRGCASIAAASSGELSDAFVANVVETITRLGDTDEARQALEALIAQ